MFAKTSRILVVDDMMTMRKLVKKNLGELGFTNIVEVSNGENAWKELENSLEKKSPFHLIISDWNMPNMTGIDLLKKVRAHAGLKDVPFIMLTAESEKSQMAQATQLKVTCYLPKPFKPEDLASKIEEASAHKKAA